MKDFVERLGTRSIAMVYFVGGTSTLLGHTLRAIVTPPVRMRQTFEQMVKIGVNSLPIVALTSFFIGVVLALQSAYQMRQVGADIYIPSLVSISITREIGPIITALVVAGRVGAAVAAELGSMKVTEQIDALQALASDPIKYLVAPRFVALLVMLPLLTVFADAIGIYGGYLVSIQKLGLTSALYIKMTFLPLVMKDIFSGLFKSVIFAGIICIISCYEGLRVEGGAEGVGNATTRAVVTSFILIIASDAVFTVLFYFLT